MKSHPASHNSGPAQAAPQEWLPYSWVWLTVALVASLLMLAGHSAAAQTQRGIEVIELAMALEPNLRRGGEEP